MPKQYKEKEESISMLEENEAGTDTILRSDSESLPIVFLPSFFPESCLYSDKVQ